MGTIVLGKLESGTIKKGQSLILMPNKVCFLVFFQIVEKMGNLVTKRGK